MSPLAPGPPRRMEACDSCLRRSWLLAELSPVLDFRAGDRNRLIALLSLEDDELLEAVGGRRRAELKARYESFRPGEVPPQRRVEAVCRHHTLYPRGLRAAEAPRMLHVVGGAARLVELAAASVVAIVGSARASDYGIEIAKSFGRGLAASGVTVTSGIGDGIPAAAQAGALESDGGTFAVIASGLGVGGPPRRRSLYERVTRRGCGVSELPHDCEGRLWGPAASERIVAGLASLTVVIEAAETTRELAPARIAQALGRTVAAVPGRVTSAQSSGTNALLMEGAPMVRGPGDALDLLSLSFALPPISDAHGGCPPELDPRLRTTLEQVGAGRDTPEKLTTAGADHEEALLALSELELMGLLARGDGGRYVPRNPIPPGP
jgi:DNA processing protein